jgi:hypothetical protein
MLGHQAGNTIVAGCAAGGEPDLARLAALAAADPARPRLAPPRYVAQVIAGAAALQDGED